MIRALERELKSEEQFKTWVRKGIPKTSPSAHYTLAVYEDTIPARPIGLRYLGHC